MESPDVHIVFVVRMQRMIVSRCSAAILDRGQECEVGPLNRKTSATVIHLLRIVLTDILLCH